MKKKTQEEGNERKRWNSAEKLRIVLAGLEPGGEVSDLCRRKGLSPALYYQWKRTLLGARANEASHPPSHSAEQQGQNCDQLFNTEEAVHGGAARKWFGFPTPTPRPSKATPL
jgi:transposase-like protein